MLSCCLRHIPVGPRLPSCRNCASRSPNATRACHRTESRRKLRVVAWHAGCTAQPVMRVVKAMKPSVAQWVVLFVAVLSIVNMSGCTSCGRKEGGTCQPEGTMACGGVFGRDVMECSEDGLWEEVASCSRTGFCVDDDGQHAICVEEGCDIEDPDLCFLLQSRDCNGTVLQVCQGRDCPMFTDVEDCADSGLVCTVETSPASCFDPTGGTGGSGGAAGNGGSAGTAGTGGTGGSGGAAGTGGSVSSCAERDVSDLPQLSGTLALFPPVATPDQLITVTADVDADTKELTATIRNENSGFPGGFCVAATDGNETVECDLRVETVADPGPHVLELELRADPLNRLDYVLYIPGDGDTYVRIEVENDVPGLETATTCRQVNATIQF